MHPAPDDGPTMVSAAQRAYNGLTALVAAHRRDGLEKLPTEAALSREFGVSRNSLREALARLETEGVVSRQRRVGTLILSERDQDRLEGRRLEYPIDDIVSIPDFLNASDHGFEIASVAVNRGRASDEEAATLDINPGAEVYRVRRKYVIDAGPVAIGEHVLPKFLGGQGIHIDALTDGVSTFLAEVERIEVTVVDHVVDAIVPGPDLAADLHVTTGTPLLSVAAALRTHADSAPVAIGRLVFNPALAQVRSRATS